jgi:1-deoxy-D-xylulose-5-phosphate reductoisomerase
MERPTLKRVAILGSTGSIGSQALEVVARHPDRFQVAGLAANTNVDRLAEQANTFRPAVISAGAADLANRLTEQLRYEPERIACGPAGLAAVAAESGADIVLAATDGMTALDAVGAAIERGIDIALSNKELAVSAGEALFEQARRRGAQILPVDSEHSAVLQCLAGEDRESVSSIVLTASGGPFWELSFDEMRAVTPEQALRHPTWVMGAKNTLDSATLMNKGLEIIEASRFFGLRPSQIEVVVHRQSVAHAFVIFTDGNVKAQLSWPDMRLPIGFALGYPERLGTPALAEPARDDIAALTRSAIGLGERAAALTFEPIDAKRFPAVGLAYRALEAGKTYPAVLSAANEEAGRAFLQGKVKFTDIGTIVEQALDAHAPEPATLPAVTAADAFARRFVRAKLGATTRT